MKLLVELLAKKAMEISPEEFESKEGLIQELIELFTEDEEGAALIAVLKDWAEQKAEHEVEIIPLR